MQCCAVKFNARQQCSSVWPTSHSLPCLPLLWPSLLTVVAVSLPVRVAVTRQSAMPATALLPAEGRGRCREGSRRAGHGIQCKACLQIETQATKRHEVLARLCNWLAVHGGNLLRATRLWLLDKTELRLPNGSQGCPPKHPMDFTTTSYPVDVMHHSQWSGEIVYTSSLSTRSCAGVNISTRTVTVA